MHDKSEERTEQHKLEDRVEDKTRGREGKMKTSTWWMVQQRVGEGKGSGQSTAMDNVGCRRQGRADGRKGSAKGEYGQKIWRARQG